MSEKSEQQAFLSFVRAGLWEKSPVHGERLKVKGCPNGASLLTLDNAQTSSELCSLNRSLQDSEHVDWEKLYQLAGEQSVVGLVTAGIERFKAHDSGFTVTYGS